MTSRKRTRERLNLGDNAGRQSDKNNVQYPFISSILLSVNYTCIFTFFSMVHDLVHLRASGPISPDFMLGTSMLVRSADPHIRRRKIPGRD